ncbi:hypothetical protein Moror_3107 [Moniliophthora roreri MCA 2997]|uniref:Uncharacterized protein n=1 Tax=Moniliophthora roreri (strain MCA 2997) TaxID=1381753 RepID=V2YAB8_MONRO|nr:hypothetical protein Moror_3107 [Moniliophthora roreri MCA 2997]
MSFRYASDMKFYGSTFTNIGGSQYNFYYLHSKPQSIWDNYERIIPGKVLLKRRIAEAPIEQDEHESTKLQACRIFSVAEITDRGTRDFLHVGYRGEHAFEAFQRDFHKFGLIKDVNVMQLSGYNEPILPALIFHQAPVPAANVFQGSQYSPILYVYFCHQLSGKIGNRVVLSELWIDSSDGSLRPGPRVTMKIGTHWAVSLGKENDRSMTGQHSSLTINAIQDDQIVFNFLFEHLETRTFFKGICLATKAVDQWVSIPIEEALSVLSFDTRTIYKQSTLEAAAQLLGIKESQPYLYKVMGLPAAVQKSKLITEDGFVRRFTFQPQDINVLGDFSLRYTLISQETLVAITETWLSQAHMVFDQLSIQKDGGPEDYSLPGMFRLYLDRKTDDTVVHREAALNQPIYLFISPISDLRAYWTLDGQGEQELSEELRRTLGLPSFTFSARFMWISWDQRAYDAIKKLQIRKGFDPSTTEFADSLGYSHLKVVDDQDRFHDEVLVEQDSFEGNLTTLLGSEEEIVLYPRRRKAARSLQMTVLPL